MGTINMEAPVYTISLQINVDGCYVVDSSVKVEENDLEKAKKTVKTLLDDYATARAKAAAPGVTPTAAEQAAERTPEAEPEPEAKPLPSTDEKPNGVKGFVQLTCKQCGNTFGTFLREPQDKIACKCGNEIDLTEPLAKLRYTCPYCEMGRYGRTNSEDATITVRCKCGGDVDLTWNPTAREYQN